MPITAGVWCAVAVALCFGVIMGAIVTYGGKREGENPGEFRVLLGMVIGSLVTAYAGWRLVLLVQQWGW